MLRHACGYRLANEGKDAFAISGMARSPKPQHDQRLLRAGG
jgi:hypothetical protein